MELQGFIDKSTIVVGAYNIVLFIVDGSNTQKPKLMDISKTWHPTTRAYKIF